MGTASLVSTAPRAAPYFPDVGVLAFVPDRWGSVWMPRHQVSTRLSRYFNVVWVNPALEWRQILKSPRAERTVPDPEEWEGFRVYHPAPWLSQLWRPDFLSTVIARARLRGARRLLAGCARTVFYLWRPAFAHVLEQERPDLSIYHIDDEYSFSDVEVPMAKEEAGLIERVDQVFIHSPALLEKKGGLNPHTAFLPNGVDFQAYARRWPEPVDLAAIPHPRIGYVGVMKKHLDLQLLINLARSHRGWSFVLIGPVGYLAEATNLFQELLQLENVHWLGSREVGQLPAYTQHLDVCLMCYRVNDYTKFIFPLKLHEYLASGRPVVGAPIRTLQDFRHVVPLCASTAEWSRAIEASLEPGACSPERVAERRRIAQAYDWELLVASIARKVCERLGGRHLDRLAALTGEDRRKSGGTAIAARSRNAS